MPVKNPSGQTITQYNVQTGDANNSLNQVSPSTATFVLTSNGVSAQPSFQAVSASGAVTNFTVDATSGTGVNPVVPTAGGNITITGGQVATGTTANVIQTLSASPNHYEVDVQRSTAVAAGDQTKNGVSHFDSASFSVSADGFVQFTGGTPSPNTLVSVVDDFAVFDAVAGLTSNYGWSTGNMDQFVVGSYVEAGHPGVIHSASLGSSQTFYITGYAAFGTPLIPFILGGGVLTINWVFKINNLSGGGNTYVLNIGMGDSTSGNDQANGIYFRYTDSVNSGNWQIVTASGSVLTTVNTAVAATTGWHNFAIATNAAATSIQFFIDGVSQGSINTNIPTSAISPVIKCRRTAGTVPNGAIAIDLIYLFQTLTNPR